MDDLSRQHAWTPVGPQSAHRAGIPPKQNHVVFSAKKTPQLFVTNRHIFVFLSGCIKVLVQRDYGSPEHGTFLNSVSKSIAVPYVSLAEGNVWVQRGKRRSVQS